MGVAPGVDRGREGKRAGMFSYASSEENIREVVRTRPPSRPGYGTMVSWFESTHALFRGSSRGRVH
jgi:hypothetical protein